jgi:hypothetical protein
VPPVQEATGCDDGLSVRRNDQQRYSVSASKLTSEEARRIGKAISGIPEFMMQCQGFQSRWGRTSLAGRSPVSSRLRGHLHSRATRRIKILSGQIELNNRLKKEMT